MAKSVFISHSSKDKRIADELVDRLETIGVGCWIAPRDVSPGTSYGEAIIKGIEDCCVCLLVLSDNSNRSDAVSKEIERAFSYQKLIVPLRVREVTPGKGIEFFVASAQWVDAFSSPIADRIEYIAAVVQATALKEPPPPPLPQRKSMGAKVEQILEKLLRYKLASATAAVSLLISLAIAGLAMQHRTQAVVQGAAVEIGNSATIVNKAGQQLAGVNNTLTTIETGVQDTKKETSTDPREELANLGEAWTSDNFNEAVSNNDIRSVTLFLAGGMPWDDKWAENAALTNESAVLAALQGRMDLQKFPLSCSIVLGDYQMQLGTGPELTDKSSLTASQASFLKDKCNNTTGIDRVQQNFNRYSNNYKNDQVELSTYKTHGAIIKKQCIDKELYDGGTSLLQEASSFNILNNLTLSPRQVFLAQLNRELMANQPIDRGVLKQQVEAYCGSVNPNPAPEADVDRQFYYVWKLLLNAIIH